MPHLPLPPLPFGIRLTADHIRYISKETWAEHTLRTTVYPQLLYMAQIGKMWAAIQLPTKWHRGTGFNLPPDWREKGIAELCDILRADGYWRVSYREPDPDDKKESGWWDLFVGWGQAQNKPV